MNSSWRRLQSVSPPNNHLYPLMDRQFNWLKNCLDKNRNTAFGRRYRFSQLNSMTEFQRWVPVSSYENLHTDIERMANGEKNILFKGIPQAFELTAGTGGCQKLIPYSAASFDDYQRAILPWIASIVSTYGLAKGRAYWSISPATRRVFSTSAGYPVGLHEGAYLGDEAAKLFAQLSIVPEWVSRIDDMRSWQLYTLYFLVRANDLELISIWSPTFFLVLLDAIQTRADAIIKLLKTGFHNNGIKLPADRLALDRLESYYRSESIMDLWPNLKLVSCWADAQSRIWFEALKEKMAGVNFQPKGLLSTECVVTIPNRHNKPVLAADSGFYEFQSDDSSIVLANALEKGHSYRMIVTTNGGLYRYQTNDCVRCDGYDGDTPILTFVGRAGVQSDMVGEKLTEQFVENCVGQIKGFRMLVAVNTGQCRYILLLNNDGELSGGPSSKANASNSGLAAEVDAKLSQNPQYQYARKLGQLGPLSVCVLSGAVDKYMAFQVSKGARLADVKIPVLCDNHEWLKSEKETVLCI